MNGSYSSLIPVSLRDLFAFFSLHFRQAATTFIQMDFPPLDFGTMWSTVVACLEQYAHSWLSRLNTPLREYLGEPPAFASVLT